MKKYLFFNWVLLAAITLLFQCKEEIIEVEDPLLPVSNIKLTDAGNNGDATDMKLSYYPASMSEKYIENRIYIGKVAQSGDIYSSTLLDNPNHMKVTPETFNIEFPAEFTDIDGDILTEEVPYKAFILSVGSDLSGQDTIAASSTLTLKQLTYVTTLKRITTAGTGGMDVDSEGNIYMGDFGNDTNGGGNKVIKLTPSGVLSTFATGFRTASGNDFDSQGNLFQSSFDGKYISKITLSGTATKYLTDPLITGPVGIAIDGDDNLYVADWRSNKILKINASKEISVYASKFLNGPNGLDFDTQGNLYVSNWNDKNIVKIGPNGETSVFSFTPSNNAHLLINGNYIYTVGRPSHNIYRVNLLTGSASKFFGNGRGDIDGSIHDAQISYPNDIAFSPDGLKMYINHVSPKAQNGSILSPTLIRVVHIVK